MQTHAAIRPSNPALIDGAVLDGSYEGARVRAADGVARHLRRAEATVAA